MDTVRSHGCTLFPDGKHYFTFDATGSGPDQSVFCCSCGEQIIEPEDCGSGC